MKVLFNPKVDEKCLYDAGEFQFNLTALGTARRYCISNGDIFKAWKNQKNFIYTSIDNMDKNMFTAEHIVIHTFSHDGEALQELPKLYPEEPILILDMMAQEGLSLSVDVMPLVYLKTKKYPLLSVELRKFLLDNILREYNVTTN